MSSRFFLLSLLLAALFASVEIGCSKSSTSGSSLISVSSEELDFGKVRPTDSPVKLSFDIHNHSRKGVVITDIISCCGCTVTDIPKGPIPANGKISVTISVDVQGRSGAFENTLIVKTAMGFSLPVAVRGNVATDIWTDGRALRCTVGQIEQYVSTVLTVYTAKYPEIVFADIQQDAGVILQEISRITKDGETTIRFFIEIHIDRNHESVAKNINIVPADISIAPLIIPIYCYREKEESKTAH